MKKLTTADCMTAVERGEFPESVVAAARAVAVVLTQSWCNQWTWMRGYLEELEAEPGREIFWVEYDVEDFFEGFMTFKEDVFGNRMVPYVRFYRDGKFVKATNFIDKTGFLRILSGG